MTQLFGWHIPLSPYWVGPIFLIAWVLVLNEVRRFLFHRLTRFAEHTENKYDDLLLAALRLPAILFILIAGLAITAEIMPLSVRLQHGLRYLHLILGITAVASFINRVLSGALDSAAQKQDFVRNSRGILNALIKILLFVIAALVFLDSIGVSITPLLASLGVGSVAVALALQDTLNNLFSGVYLLIDRPIAMGDTIKLESGEEGVVDKVGWRSTRLKLLNNNVIIIPNAKIASSTLTNYDLQTREMAVLVPVGVHCQSDLEKVEEVALEVAREVLQRVPGAVADFTPALRFNQFAESSITCNVVLRASEFGASFLLRHEFIKALQKRFTQEGIVIPYPTRTLQLAEKLPPELSPAGYRPAE